MAKSIVLYGPQGSGKTLHGSLIAQRLGLQNVKDLDDVQLDCERLQRFGFLYLANHHGYAQRAANLLGTQLMDIEQALALAGVRQTAHKAETGVADA